MNPKRPSTAASSSPKRASRGRPGPPLDVDPRWAIVIEAFARDPEVSTGSMMASVGLKVNGKIFALLSRGRFVAKLPGERVDELVRAGLGDYFDPRRDGRLMKEWIALKGARPPWLELATEAHRFVKSKT